MKYYMIPAIVIIIILCTLIVDYLFLRKDKFMLVGNKEITIEVFDKYEEKGTIYEECSKFSCEEIKVDEKISGKVDTNIVGDYTITYDYKDNTLNRVIHVVDKTAPEIENFESNPVFVQVGSEYVAPTYKVTDNYDKDIEGQLEIQSNVKTDTIGTYTVTYSIKDSSGNTATKTTDVYVTDFNNTDVKNCILDIEEYVKNHDISIGYYNLTNNYQYTYKENAIYYGASLIKTLAALYAYEKLELTDAIKTDVSLAISISKNSSYRNLHNIIGGANLKEYGKSLGATLTLEPEGLYGNTNVLDQFAYLKKLYSFVNTNPLGDELKAYFINEKGDDVTLPGGPVVLHKYGHHTYAHHDVGVVLDEKPYLIVVLTNEAKTNYPLTIIEISKKIYNLHQVIKNTETSIIEGK